MTKVYLSSPNREPKRIIKKPGRITIYPKSSFERMKRRGFYNPWYANDTSAFRPEMWAIEAIRIMVEEMVMASTVSRNYSDEIARYGEIVHVHKIPEFQANRKQNDMDNLETSDVEASQIEVRLNQRIYTSFRLGDYEQTVSFKDLVATYLVPAIRGQVRMLDQVLAGQAYQFLDNVAGGAGTLAASNAHDYLMDLREVMNNNKVDQQGRFLALASRSETQMQKADLFKSAERIGDNGTALRNASLGRLGGFDTFLELNMPAPRNVTTGSATTLASAAIRGDTTVSVASASGLATGMYIVIAGDGQPLRITNIVSTDVTVARPLHKNVATGASVTPIALGAIDQGSPIAKGDKTAPVSDGYPAGWVKGIHVDGTGVPTTGQLVSFKASGGTLYTPEYSIVRATPDGNGDYDILLDRPLEHTVADGDVVCYGPAGDFNFAYLRDALTLVTRPMLAPNPMTGVSARVVSDQGLSVRVVLTYNGENQTLRVTVDSIFGVATLDTDKGAVLIG